MATYTTEQLTEAIATSTSIRQVLIKLGLSAKGGNSATVKRLAAKHNIDTTHFLGTAQKGQPKPARTDINAYLNNEKPCGSFRLKSRLLKEGIIEPKCTCCGNTEWLSNPIPLELDHIDGNSENNSLTNLRLLCPNCHALTPTYRGKNKASARDGDRTRTAEAEGF